MAALPLEDKARIRAWLETLRPEDLEQRLAALRRNRENPRLFRNQDDRAMCDEMIQLFAEEQAERNETPTLSPNTQGGVRAPERKLQ